MEDMDKKEKISSGDKDHILEVAKERLKRAIDADNHNRVEALDDLRFIQGDQWDEKEKQRRKDRDRPCLQINVLPKYVKQICGEMRKNKVQIKVHPVDSQADVELAKIREGIIYGIEYLSNAESIYISAGEMLAKCGYGAWRVLTRYSETEEDPFMQEIFYERIENPLSVYMDVNAKDKLFADAKWAFILSKMTKDEFEKEFGKDKLPGNGLDTSPIGTLDEHWYDKDTVTIAEYFDTEYEKKTMCKLSDNRAMELEEAEHYIESIESTFAEVKDQDGKNQSGVMPPEIIKRREVKIPKIVWRKITASEILDEREWSGSIVPIVLLTGEETNIGGKKHIKGLIRDAKDPQRMLNYWHSSACETVALAPKAPWLATAKMIEGYEEDYANAHIDNLPYLLYNHDPEFPQEKPTRTGVGQAPMAIFAEIGRAEKSVKDTIGMYNVDVGDTSDENLRDVSGKAVAARQAPGDTATFVYLDILAQGIAHGGKIANDIVPNIMTEPRNAHLKNMDGTETFAPINTTVGEAMSSISSNPQKFAGMNLNKLKETQMKEGVNAPFNEITRGKYNIAITTGPTFATQRAEAVENIVRIATATQMNPVDKYFIIKNSDFPGSDEYANVIKRMIPPGILPPEEGGVPVPQGPNTAEQMEEKKLKLEEMKARTEQLKLQLQTLKLMEQIKGGEANIRKEIIDIQRELESPTHPADQIGG